MKYASLMIALLMMSGCAGAIVGGIGAVGTASVQERSIGDNLDDKAIATEILNFFIQSKVPNMVEDVSVRVHEGRVLLTGRTASADVALEAVRLAWVAAGVREVINEIKVGAKGTNLLNYTKDNLTETQIEARLLATKNIRSVNYTVEVIEGTAYILGVAQDETERRNVAAIASMMRGVNKVVSYVRLKSDPVRLQKTGKLRTKGTNRN